MTTVDEYIAGFGDDQRAMLEALRAAIHRSVPGGEERIRYGMPAIMLGGSYAIHFAAWKKHLGLYPVPTLEPSLEQRIAPFRTAKDSVTFPYGAPIPYDLIEEVAAAIYQLRAR